MDRLARLASALLLAGALASLLALSTALTVAAQEEPAATANQNLLRINEVMADNTNTLVDPDEPDETPDWIELYNPTPNNVSLNGLALTDDLENPVKFPITTGLSVPAFGFLVFYADDDTQQGPLHTNFRLGADGESVGLFFVASQQQIDAVTYDPLETDVSWGRKPDGVANSWGRRSPATPGTSNSLNPPRIDAVTPPPYPAPAGAPVSISAVVTPAETADSPQAVNDITVTLWYSVAGQLRSVPMASTGGNGYSGELPAQPAGRLVSYFVQAQDGDLDVARFPMPGREYRYLTGYVAPPLILNEVVPSNGNLRVDRDEPNETPDWIEIYNPTNAPIQLRDLYLSNDKNNTTRHRIPDQGTVLTIPARGRVTFLADDDKGQGPLHLNFTLNRGGDFVGLYGGQGTVLIDSLDYDDPPLFGSISRFPDGSGEWDYAACLTFNRVNVLCDKRVNLPIIRR